MKMEDVTAIAITYGPGLIGSLLVGMQAAKTLSYIYNKPLVVGTSYLYISLFIAILIDLAKDLNIPSIL